MRRLTLMLGLALATVGCGSDGPTGPAVEVSGFYALQTYNGNALPVLAGEDETGADVYILSSVFNFDPSGACSETTVYRTGADPEDEGEAVTNQCAYSVNGSRIFVSYAGGGDIIGQATETTLTFDVGSIRLVYRK